MERVGLVTSGFQFLLGLAAVFAQEVGGFVVVFGQIKRCSAIHIRRIHIRTFGNE